MHTYFYENHDIAKQRLPFIYYKLFTLNKRNSRPNWHENIELLYCIDGEGYVKNDSEHTVFTAGDIFVVNANALHCIGTDSTVSYRCLIIDDPFFEENGIPVSKIAFQKLIRDSALCSLFDAVDQAIANAKENHICTVADIRYAVLGLLRTLCRQYSFPKQDTACISGSNHIKKAIRYIKENIHQSITLDNIVAHVGISKFHLVREFKIYTGSTVINTVNLIRCTEAKRLIEMGVPVSTAASSCGYNNLSYFTRTFQKHFQVLPSSLLPKNKKGTPR